MLILKKKEFQIGLTCWIIKIELYNDIIYTYYVFIYLNKPHAIFHNYIQLMKVEYIIYFYNKLINNFGVINLLRFRGLEYFKIICFKVGSAFRF